MVAVAFLLDVGEKKAEIMNCETCERPLTTCPTCPIQSQPTRLEEAGRWLKLYARTKRWNALPAAGGLEDQEERVMQILDQIDTMATARKPAPQGGAR